jgi:malate dehydrogenase (oxaloacetate-decarboxylating)(NADP+)
MKGSLPSGEHLLHDPRFNKGTAFTEAERDALGIRGLLPPRVFTMAQQQVRVLGNLRREPTDLEKYIFMAALLDRNETLFYRTVIDNIQELMPIIYTPTVGKACQEFGHIFRRSRGLYVTGEDRGGVADVLKNWPRRDVAVIVVTDGERILGLGDLGAHGMGIPIGKLSLYTACAGIDPARCLPIMLDVGTENETLLGDELYTGLMHRRLRGEAYGDLLEEFVTSVKRVFPGALIQFEDFATHNAFGLLAKYRERACVFNDDIQGTAAVTLAGLYSAGRITGRPLSQEHILLFGAGEAGCGIADLVTSAMTRQGLSPEEARRRCWLFDSKGLVVRARDDLKPHKRAFAQEHPPVADLLETIEALRPTALIGASGQPKTFTGPVLQAMAAHHQRPIVFALSNPTSRSECTAEEAYSWTEGRAIFASGSPFSPVVLGESTFVPGQGNNAYIFPGVGLGVVASGARHVTDELFTVAATTLAHMTEDSSLRTGTVFPPLTRIREVSHAIAMAVAEEAFDSGLATGKRPDDLSEHVRSMMYEPVYPMYS